MTQKDEMLLFLKIKSMGMTPDEYFFVMMLEKGQLHLLNYSRKEPEQSILQKFDTFAKAIAATKGEVDELSEFVEKYRSLFPKGRLPSGRPARATQMEVVQKMKWFMVSFHYSNDQILEKTKKYVDSFLDKGYKFMQNASSFIYRDDKSRVRQSTLLEMLEDEGTSIEVSQPYFGDDV